MKKLLSLFLVLQFFTSFAYGAGVIEDEFAQRTLAKKGLITENSNFNSKKDIAVAVEIDNYITTRENIFEGEELKFKVAKDVTIDGKTIIQKGTPVIGRVELIIPNGPFGAPAQLTIGNFKFENDNTLEGEIHKIGANRAYWVYPVGALSFLVFFVGLLVLTVRGGHAKIKPAQQYKLDYALSL